MSRQAAACAAILLGALAGMLQGYAAADVREQRKYTFELIGGYFYGPGPIVPDTLLPDGKLRNIQFDTGSFRGYCEFANDGSRKGLLSDGRTRINQNIDAGRLMIGGGTTPVLLTAVDGGPHQGTEQYYLDDQYRFVWRVDIALDPGFEEGIIRLNDFVLNTGVARVGRSLQTQRGIPGGYDQAGTLQAGEYIAGRVGDFDHDGFLDGVLVAAPHVPMAADMLPGAPVANLRGFRTNLPISAQLSAELMLRGAVHLREPIDTTLAERGGAAGKSLLVDLEQRIRAARKSAANALAERQWSRDRGTPESTLAQLSKLEHGVAALAAAPEDQPASVLQTQIQTVFSDLGVLIGEISALNERSNVRLSITRVANRDPDTSAAEELHRKSY